MTQFYYTIGYKRTGQERKYDTAVAAERYARRRAKAERAVVTIWTTAPEPKDTQVATVWPTGQVDLTFTGSRYL